MKHSLHFTSMQAQEYYSSNILKGKTELKRLKKTLLQYAMLRLFIFLSIVGFSYLFRSNISIVLLVIVLGISLFLLFVSRFTDAKNQRKYYKKYVQINEDEFNLFNGDLTPFDTGEQFISEEHYYNQDIDLFGEGSIFQHICRSKTKNGIQNLANILNSNNIDSIEEKQITIKELSKKENWRQHFQITASLIEKENQTEAMLKWIKNYQPIIPQYLRFLPFIFSLFSIVAIGGYFMDLLPGKYLLYWFLIGLMITGKYVKKVTHLYQSASKMQDTFTQYAHLLDGIEKESFDCDVLKEKQKIISTNGLKASELLRKYTAAIDHLGQRNNLLFSPPANGFFLWDILSAYRVEKWLVNFKSTVKEWFEVIEYFDAMNSLGNYTFNNQGYVFPVLSEKNTTIKATELGHPLLRKDQLVSNDIELLKDEFFIITGANMAGKSTFLRTIALNIVLANCGLPVQAKSFSYEPIKLISSMRTSDSLQNDESYFFSELKRLKFIVDEIKNDRFFIILDEILKGTNSKDKAEGSKKFVKKLVDSKSTGVIATHDLSLCTLAEELPEVKNHYFDAEIIDDELFFDYTFKKGICQNMNASFLLKKMEIV